MRTSHRIETALVAAVVALAAYASADALGQGEITGGGTMAEVRAAEPLPAGGESLIDRDADGIARFDPPRAADAPAARTSVVAVPDGLPFARAVRVQTLTETTPGAAVRLEAASAVPLREGDTLFVRFYLRRVEGDGDGDGAADQPVKVVSTIERTTPGAPRLVFPGAATAGRQWARYDMSPARAMGVSENVHAPGAVRFVLSLSGPPQTVEIAGLEVLNYGRRVLPHQLPYRASSYAGREPDAAWRRAAAARIDAVRKADLTVRVVDAGGRPVPDAEVDVRMTRHAFRFGACVNENFLLTKAGTPDNDVYRRTIVRLFNHAVLEGGMRPRMWGSTEANRQKVRDGTRWLRDNGLTVRGHTLAWPAWRNYPAAARAAFDKDTAERGQPAAVDAVRRRLRAYVHDTVAAFRGQITDWDVVNETKTNRELLDLLGDDELVEWFRVARAADPSTRLCFNEYNLLSGKHLENFERHVRLLQAAGAPLDVLGEQGHGSPLPMPQVFANLDRLAAFGLPLQITEFDAVTPDEQLQADWTRDFLTAAFSHPSVEAFTVWGFWDGRHWLGDGAMFYEDWTIKPAGRAWVDLVHGAWWTKAAGRTGGDGTFAVRGFLGEYEVVVTTADGRERKATASLPRAGRAVDVALAAD